MEQSTRLRLRTQEVGNEGLKRQSWSALVSLEADAFTWEAGKFFKASIDKTQTAVNKQVQAGRHCHRVKAIALDQLAMPARCGS